jgi:uncharacterized surface protein with fasciclin (FAS1) repeats
MRIRHLLAPAVIATLVVASGDDGDDTAPTTSADVTTAAPATDPMTTDPMTSDTTSDTTGDTMTGDTAMAAEGDIVDTAIGAGSFSTLVAAVQAAGLEETLRGEGPFTVFAPTDDAFAALPAGTLDTLLADPTGDLASILTYHVVEGEVMAADVVGMDGQEVTTVNGATFTVNVADDGTVTLTDAAGNEVGVVQTDVQATNGVIHVIDGVLLPG